MSHAIVAIVFSSAIAMTAQAQAQAQAGNSAGAEQSAPAQYTSAQLRRYALALLQVQQVKQTLAVRLDSANEPDKLALQSQAKVENRAILQRYNLDVATFNAMTNAVDTRPTVRGKVRQTVMQQTLALWK